MQEDIENKSLTLIINTSKLTARTLATAFMKFLRYSRNKIQAHQNVKPQGKQSVRQLIAQNQGVENTELADRNEAKSFDRYARQYGVDYAVQKGYSQEGKPRYILYFKARDRSAINQAMAAYSPMCLSVCMRPSWERHGTWLTARTCRESCSTSWTGYPLHFAHRGPALFLQTFCWASPLAA